MVNQTLATLKLLSGFLSQAKPSFHSLEALLMKVFLTKRFFGESPLSIQVAGFF
ncbi:MAG: hypothetical protein H7X84_07020 [Verrucomicrobia bacterium]|nr:hypothetical protein [Prolixibacteraceae bacterium]